MKQNLRTILLSGIVSFVTIVLVLNVPARWFDVSLWFTRIQLGGLTLTDILTTDKLSAYPTTQNANNTALETVIDSITGTTTNSTITTLSGLTTASALATVGTITSGTWNGDTLSVAYGGTGSTTLSQYSVLLGSTTNAVSVVNGLGTTGQFLTSQGTGAKPIWTTSSVDLAGNYAWTGLHTWSQLIAIGATATSTFASGLEAGTKLGAPYIFATSTTATSTFLGGVFINSATTTNLSTGRACSGCIGGAGGWERITATAALNTTDEDTTGTSASCTAGKVAVGGGYNTPAGAQGGYILMDSYPPDSDTWEANVSCENASGTCSAGNLTVYVICVKP